MTIQHVADALQVDPRTVRRYVSQGRLNVQRFSGTVVRVYNDDLERFQRENLRLELPRGATWVPCPPDVVIDGVIDVG